MDRLSKTLRILLVVLVGVGIAYLSVNLYGKWEGSQPQQTQRHGVNPFRD